MNKQVWILIVVCLHLWGSVLLLAQDNATPADVRMKDWEHHQRLKEESPFKDLEWRAVGPEFCGGRIETIACHPDEPYTIYVGAGSGNLWKTVNNGTTWEPIFENESTFAIGCVAIAPSDPKIVWVGTGEVLMARSSYAGTGVFKSTDAGKTWQNMGLHDSHHVPRIVIDSANPDVVYVAALGHNYGYNEERGVYKTIDGGKTWGKSLFVSEKAGIVEIVMDPSDNKTLYAAAWERDRKAWNNVVRGEESGLYKTIDAGKTWERLTEGLPAGEYVGRFGLAVAPSEPNVVYALLDNHAPPPEGTRRRRRGEIYRSDDKGETWKKRHEEGVPTAIGYDFCLVRVSPDNPDEIFVLGNKLIHSIDGGKTYEEAGETANIIFGAVVDEDMDEEVRVTVIATGFNSAAEEFESEQRAASIVDFENSSAGFDISKEVRKAAGMVEDGREIPLIVDESFGSFDTSRNHNLEYPTFLRRQAD